MAGTRRLRAARRLVCLLAPAVIAGAGGAGAADPARLERCAAAYLPGDVAGAAADCVGRLAAGCLAGPGGDTTLGRIDCLGAESRAWDVLLNRDWPQLMAAARAMDAANGVAELGLPALAGAERAAQRAWLAWREAECAALRAAWGAGSHGRVVAAECWLRLTARRVLTLRARLMELPR